MSVKRGFSKELLITVVQPFISTVTLIRMLRSRLEMNSKNSKIQTKRALKGIGSMGEPLAPVIKRWYANYFLKERTSL